MVYDENFKQFEASFWELSRKTEMLWNRVFKETFPGSQSKLMYILKQEGPLKMSEIAESLQLTAGAVTTSADHLIKQNYIERQPSVHDRRIIQLQLTPYGENTLLQLESHGRKQLQHVFQNLNSHDLQWMKKQFHQAIAHIDSLEEEEF